MSPDAAVRRFGPRIARTSGHSRTDKARSVNFPSGMPLGGPASLGEAMKALEDDNAFLMKGDVFTEDLIQVWIKWKRDKEIDALRLRPHPYEFDLYYNC